VDFLIAENEDKRVEKSWAKWKLEGAQADRAEAKEKTKEELLAGSFW
jgi:hypothetical protein